MKKLTVVLVTGLMISFVAHAEDENDGLQYSAQVGIQAIARTVVVNKLVRKASRDIIILALETGRAGFGPMQCERELGKDRCVIPVFIKDDESTDKAEETLFHLNVLIYQGVVRTATFTLAAG